MSLTKQQDGCRNYTERSHKNVNWCEKAETDLITHLVKLPELVPPRKTSRESAHCNEHEPAENDADEPRRLPGRNPITNQTAATPPISAKSCDQSSMAL